MNSIHSLTEPTPAPGPAHPEQHTEPHITESQASRHAPRGTAVSLSPTSHPAQMPQLDGISVRHQRPSTPPPAVHLLHHAAITPLRKDTSSSVSTQATAATLGSSETNPTSYSADTSPSLHQSIFSIKDGSDVSNNRRASRRRTGPLSQQSRERAALIRKLGACPDCRRRRVACHPSHHDMTWADVVTKFNRTSPTIQDLAPSVNAGRPMSPVTPMRDTQHIFGHEAHEMEIDEPSSHNHPNRLPLGDSRLRTPLPSGPRLEKSLSLPGIESFKNDLQTTANKIVSISHRGRYSAARVLLLIWQDDDEAAVVHTAAQELADVLEKHYRYTFQIQAIPAPEPGLARDTWRWLSRTLDRFAEDDDHREVLKVVYYAGHTFLDGNREMNLASSRDPNKASFARWSTIQQPLEQATSDVLVIMDAAFYPCSRIIRQHGIFEILAASLSDDHVAALGRCTFTKALSEQLRIRAGRGKPLSAVELHSILLSAYPKMVQDRHPENEALQSFPTPLHMMTTGNSRLPSVFVSPILQTSALRSSFSYENNPQIQLTINLNDENVDIESWNEWLRLIPESAKDVRIDGPFRSSFR